MQKLYKLDFGTANYQRCIIILQAADIFNISDDTVQMVFKTWLIYMYKRLGHPKMRQRMFVKFKDLPKPLPPPFRNQWCEKVRVVIDTTRIKVCTRLLFLVKGDFLGYEINQ